jgi:hypothetical protein
MPLFSSLELAAAVTSGWPVLHVYCDDENAMLAARSRIESSLGALPQTDEIEPWDDQEPDWELRIALPRADIQSVLAGARAAEPHRVRVKAGPPPGIQYDLDRGRPVAEDLLSGIVHARLWSDPEDGGSGLPDLRTCPADADIEALDRDIALALQAGGVTAAFRSDRGDDTVVAVVHRPSGRLGIRIQFIGTDVDRKAVVDALATLVAERSEHPTIRLATDMCWDVDNGTAFTVWLVAPTASRLPADAMHPRKPGELTALLASLDASTPQLEVHVMPATPDLSDAAIQAISDFPLPNDVMVGDAPRWLGDPAIFCPTWRLDQDALPPRAIEDWVQRVTQDPAIAQVRVVPSAPLGLEERWNANHVSWRMAADMAFVRIRDPLLDRDRHPERTPADTPDWARVFEGMPGIASLRGFRGADDGEMVGVNLVKDAIHSNVLDGILNSIATRRPAQVRSVAWWAYQGDRATLYLSARQNRS